MRRGTMARKGVIAATSVLESESAHPPRWRERAGDVHPSGRGRRRARPGGDEHRPGAAAAGPGRAAAPPYDDVFGNRARRAMIETPFHELVIGSHSLVVTL